MNLPFEAGGGGVVRRLAVRKTQCQLMNLRFQWKFHSIWPSRKDLQYQRRSYSSWPLERASFNHWTCSAVEWRLMIETNSFQPTQLSTKFFSLTSDDGNSPCFSNIVFGKLKTMVSVQNNNNIYCYTTSSET
jgi:hypothetical protein